MDYTLFIDRFRGVSIDGEEYLAIAIPLEYKAAQNYFAFCFGGFIASSRFEIRVNVSLETINHSQYRNRVKFLEIDSSSIKSLMRIFVIGEHKRISRYVHRISS